MNIKMHGTELLILGFWMVAACSGLQAAAYKVENKGDLYSVNGKKVSVDDLGPAARQALYDTQKQHYDNIVRIIEGSLLDDHIKREAKAKKKSEQEIEAELFSAKVSEKEAKEWYEANKARLGGRSFDSIKSDVNHYLSRQKMEEKKDEVLESLKKAVRFNLAVREPVKPRVDISLSGFPVKGAKDAKVTIVEFADYKCPHCREASKTLKKVLEKYKSKVRLVYLDFPLRDAGVSSAVAEGGVCADKQKKFWEYHYMAFEEQHSLNNDSPVKLAEKLKLDLATFKKCLTEKATRERVVNSKLEGQRIGVQGTPAIYVNGIKHSGYSEESLEEEIKNLL